MIDLFNWLNTHPLVGLLLIAWMFYWKGRGLWRSAQLEDKWWFIAILLISSFGLLEIIYIYIITKDDKVEVIENK